jgi:uncharacterized protein (DUF1330 family)
MSVYLIAEINIHDRVGYASYEAGFMAIFSRHKGKLLAVEESPEPLEGTWEHTRTVLIEFPSAALAHAWYDSAEYQALAKHRLASSEANVVLVKGLELPTSDRG